MILTPIHANANTGTPIPAAVHSRKQNAIPKPKANPRPVSIPQSHESRNHRSFHFSSHGSQTSSQAFPSPSHTVLQLMERGHPLLHRLRRDAIVETFVVAQSNEPY